uniref:MATH domain-containing protein n=1 Tax=Psilocybe cubensis TaxID=181762 RepID=A0A8H8CH56_PSICU
MDNIDINSEYSESSSITFEWTLSGLKSLFDSTKGDKKSKVTKSIRFGNNRWQILFYANAGPTKDGTEGGGFVSLYLSCEPTVEEKEASLNLRWVREGVYKFSFELRNVGKNVLYNAKEAHNHSFTYKTANWGWAQFARRDSVYYQSLPVKAQDAFVIICTITSSPAAPSQTLPRQPVPKALLDTVGSLLDDPLYSDVQFIIPNRHQSLSNARKIWASKKLLQRSEYFETSVSDPLEQSIGTPQTISHTSRRSHRRLNMILDEFEDSDNDDEEFSESRSRRLSSSDGTDDFALSLPDSNTEDGDRSETQSTISEAHFASPPTEPFSEPVKSIQETIASVPPKMTIVVRDAAYNTYRAMLYYVNGTLPPSESIPSTPSEGCQVPGAKRISSRDQSSSRAEWIKEWMAANPGRPAPCSAKSMYRIADSM